MRTRSCLLGLLAILGLILLGGQGCPTPAGPVDGTTGATDTVDDGDDWSGDDLWDDDSSLDDDSGPDADDEANGSDDDFNDAGDCSPASSATLSLFDEVWSTFDAKYSYFTHKDLDWDDIRSRYRCDFAPDLAPAAFAAQLNDMLQELHDWHVNVFPPEGDPLGYSGDVVKNFPPRLMAGYTREGAYATLGDNVMFHATVGDNVAHIVIDTLDTTAFASVSDNDIEALFVAYAGADGMIIDLRDNSGGNENNAIKFASRFIDEAVTYGYVATRNGPGHDDFDPLITKAIEPGAGTHYSGPVVCLIGQRCLSSAEWFTLMMRAAGATLIGDRTRGGSGNPETFSLANGVSYRLSRWLAYDADMEVFEDVGIAPDIELPPGEGSSYDDTRDYVLEFALDWLEPAG